jgi:hypothetical protein
VRELALAFPRLGTTAFGGPAAHILIRTMARENAPWGAERIRGESLKLGIKEKTHGQKYMRAARRHPP